MSMPPLIRGRASCRALASSALVFAALAASPTVHAQARVWEAASEYSSTQNPSGVWSYGWALNRGAPLNPFTQSGTTFCGSLRAWSNRFPQFPAVTKNESGQTECCSSIRMPPGQIALHPGQAGENAVLRWTAPDDGYYYVEVSFAGVDFSFPTNSDVAVLHNLTPLFAAELGAFSGPAGCPSTSWAPVHAFARVVQCFRGDSVDVNVGFGRNQRFNGDSTLVTARVTRVTTTEQIGGPCGGRATLSTSLPFLGQTLNLGLGQAANNAVGILDVAAGPPQASPLLGCTLHPSLGAQLGTLPLTTNNRGEWQGFLMMPADPQLHGAQLTMQALIASPAAPAGWQFSNGWLLTL